MDDKNRGFICLGYVHLYGIETRGHLKKINSFVLNVRN